MKTFLVNWICHIWGIEIDLKIHNILPNILRALSMLLILLYLLVFCSIQFVFVYVANIYIFCFRKTQCTYISIFTLLSQWYTFMPYFICIYSIRKNWQCSITFFLVVFHHSNFVWVGFLLPDYRFHTLMIF